MCTTVKIYMGSDSITKRRLSAMTQLSERAPNETSKVRLTGGVLETVVLNMSGSVRMKPGVRIKAPKCYVTWAITACLWATVSSPA